MRYRRTASHAHLYSLRAMLAAIAVVAILLAISLAVQQTRRSAIASAAQSPLNQLSLALHNYHEVYGCFPPAYVVGNSGVPWHSWRVLILPFIGEEALYNQYDFSEPWNGPSNAQLANQMPAIFRSPSEEAPLSATDTNVVVICGLGRFSWCKELQVGGLYRWP